jgi:hypothetical protein
MFWRRRGRWYLQTAQKMLQKLLDLLECRQYNLARSRQCYAFSRSCQNSTEGKELSGFISTRTKFSVLESFREDDRILQNPGSIVTIRYKFPTSLIDRDHQSKSEESNTPINRSPFRFQQETPTKSSTSGANHHRLDR